MAEKSTPGSMPRMVPDRDDIRQHKPSTGQERKGGEEKRTSAPVPHKTSWATVTLLIVLGVAVGFLALQQYSMYQLQASYEERLALADERIVNLEKALTQTDESVAFNETAINAQFKAIKTDTDLHMSEIRKLWDVSNKRNRGWIEENQNAVAAQLEQIKKAQADLSELAESQAGSDSSIAELGDQFEQLSNVELAKLEQAIEQNLLTVEQNINAVELNLQAVQSNQEEITAVSSRLADVGLKLDSLEQSNLEERLLTLTITQENLLAEQTRNSANLAEVIENIKAIDAGRLETSKRLTSLTNQLDTVNARVTALTGSSQ